MPVYKDVFPRPNSLIAVIHAEDQVQVLRNVDIAHDNGADGVFLINHSISVAELLQAYGAVREKFPSYWTGINLLGENPIDAANLIPFDTNGLWVDNAGIDKRGVSDEAKHFEAYRRKSPWKGLYFGGVAFKYQEHVDDVALAAQRAKPFVDVITTSGEGTGQAPNIEKIKQMGNASGLHPLAIASGITPENVKPYLPYADCFLVATGISDSHTELNAARVAELAKIIGA